MEFLRTLPPLYVSEDAGTPLMDIPLYRVATIVANGWVYYAAEYDADKDLMWGLVDGFEAEFGYTMPRQQLETLDFNMPFSFDDGAGGFTSHEVKMKAVMWDENPRRTSLRELLANGELTGQHFFSLEDAA